MGKNEQEKQDVSKLVDVSKEVQRGMIPALFTYLLVCILPV